MVGGVSPTGSGDAFMVLDDKDNMKGVNIVHELMHALGLDHTFDPKNKHAFTLGKTDNYMDYKNSKKHTYKWQWEQLRNNSFTTD